jgi:hypothetical protein
VTHLRNRAARFYKLLWRTDGRICMKKLLWFVTILM